MERLLHFVPKEEPAHTQTLANNHGISPSSSGDPDFQTVGWMIESLNMLHVPAFICESDASLLAASAKGQILLDERQWFTLRGKVLQTIDPSAQAGLLAALQQSGASEPPDNVVIRDKAGVPLLVEILPCPVRPGANHPERKVLLARPARRRDLWVSSLSRKVFGLTEAESIVASYLVAGKSVAEIAKLCGITVGTARSHLKRIFDKSGARSQAEVVARLAAFF